MSESKEFKNKVKEKEKGDKDRNLFENEEIDHSLLILTDDALEDLDQVLDENEMKLKQNMQPELEEYEEEQQSNLDQQETKEELEDTKYILTNLIPSVATVINRITKAGVVTVVKSSKSSHRVSIAPEVYSNLNNPTKLQVGFVEKDLVIAEYLSDEFTSYSLKQQGAKHIVYNKELVEQISEHCELDFSSRTSITFQKVTYKNLNNQSIAIISLN